MYHDMLVLLSGRGYLGEIESGYKHHKMLLHLFSRMLSWTTVSASNVPVRICSDLRDMILGSSIRFLAGPDRGLPTTVILGYISLHCIWY